VDLPIASINRLAQARVDGQLRELGPVTRVNEPCVAPTRPGQTWGRCASFCRSTIWASIVTGRTAGQRTPLGRRRGGIELF